MTSTNTQKRTSKETKEQGVSDYLNGMSYREVAQKYGVDHKVVMWWVRSSGNKSRSKEEANKLMSVKTKGQRRSISSEFKKGIIPWNYKTKGVMKPNITSFKKGEHKSPQTEYKKGEHHIYYIDGRSWEKYPSEFTFKLKTAIRTRDNFVCQNCGMTEKEHLEIYRRRLDVHHIDYNKKNCNENNLITLCKQCNLRANSNRSFWEELYKSKLLILKHG